MQRVITTKHFFDGDVLHGSTRIVIDDGVVAAIEQIDCDPDSFLVTPGFVDVQVNGFEDIDCSLAEISELSSLDHHLRQLGTTHWLATIITAPLDKMNSSISRVNEYCSSANSTGCEGIHLEGPFLGEAPGAHNKNWVLPFDRLWIEQLPASVKLMTVGPEREAAELFVRQLVSQQIVVSIGHTKATDSEFDQVTRAGATMVTHLFNGMSGIHHRTGGVALRALTSSNITTGLIADLAHVTPEILSLVFLAKGCRSVVLVSDAIAWNHERAVSRGIEVRDGAPRLPDDTLAGSCVSLAECVRNCVSIGLPLSDVLTAATSSPADIMGFQHAGRIRIGHPVDLNILNQDLLVTETLFRLPSIRG